MFSTYHNEDVVILLKDITGRVVPLGTAEREKFIQSGVYYSEMLPIEYEPSPLYLNAYSYALRTHSERTAWAVASVSQKIVRAKGQAPVLVSLARAGTSIGILIKRYLERKYGAKVSHYTISIIRGKGIDTNAMNYILQRHRPDSIQFVDGWTGKGAIQRELNAALRDYPGVSSGLAVLSDPAGTAAISGTRQDFLIAGSCLNSTVSGLLSRTFLRNDLIGENDFHGAMFYSKLQSQDRTYEFIETVEKHFPLEPVVEENVPDANTESGLDEVRRLGREFSIPDINLIKPGIGEATRVLLRRVPWKILVKNLDDTEFLGPLYQLAEEKGVPVEIYPLKNYRACGIIKTLADH